MSGHSFKIFLRGRRIHRLVMSRNTAYPAKMPEARAAPDPKDETFAALRAAYAEAVAKIEALPNHVQAFHQATALRDTIDQLVGEAASLRARMAGRVWEVEELSLAGLADKIGVSRSRAEQFVKASRAAKEARKEE
jgi:hypothetical protein